MKDGEMGICRLPTEAALVGEPEEVNGIVLRDGLHSGALRIGGDH